MGRIAVTGAAPGKCPRCQGPLILRKPLQLFLAGVLLCASLSIAFFTALFWIPGLILFLAGAYLIAWSTLAQGRWCRQCKSFPVGPWNP
jgi:hypothetical protein